MPFGVHSEVGRLHQVIVHRPGLEHTRLTPSNAGELLVREAADPTSMLLPPLPNFLFQRDPSCRIFNGVTINPMTKPARKPETMIMDAIYRFHPMFAAETFPVWLGGHPRIKAGRQPAGASGR